MNEPLPKVLRTSVIIIMKQVGMGVFKKPNSESPFGLLVLHNAFTCGVAAAPTKKRVSNLFSVI